MAICKICGNTFEDGAKFCPSCGAPAQQEPAQSYEPQQEQPQNDFAAKLQDLNNTADTTAEFEQADIEKNKVMGVLAYLSWLVLIPIFAAKDSKFARFHVNQGLVLAIAEFALIVLSGLLSQIPVIGFFIGIIFGLVNIAFFVVSIIGIINAATGKAKELPVIGKFRIFK